jgi:hypothetical protein
LDGYDLLNVSIALPFLIKTMNMTAPVQGLLRTATYLVEFLALFFSEYSAILEEEGAL